MHHVAWPSLFLMLYLGCLCCAAYNKLAVMFLRIKTLSSFWVRFNQPLQAFGGFWIPSHIIHTFSPALGYLVRLNPLMYLTEGIRQALIGGPDFLPIWQCASALLFMSIFFSALACYFFKNRVDHI
jgi:ABC-2 type transport system permease protein